MLPELSDTSLSILIVEGDDEGTVTAAAALRADGHTVHLAPEALSARLHASHHHLDAVIVGVRADRSNAELARHLRHDVLSPSCVIVALVGRRQQPPDPASFDACVHEPVDAHQLSGLLHHLRLVRQG
jgi:DNA-binding response OmpR family regulator